MPLLFFGSPKGGVGKTTVAANVAAALAQLGFAVTAIDLDPQNALRLHFGVQLQDPAGFAWTLAQPPPAPAWPVAPQTSAPWQGATPWQGAPPSPGVLPWQAFLRQTQWGVSLLPFGEVDMPGALAVADALARYPERLGVILQELLADPRRMVVIDSPPGPSSAMSAALPYVDMLICVLLADAISAALLPSIDAGRAFGPGTQLGQEGGRMRYVLNQCDANSRLSRATAEALRPHLGGRLLGEVRRDDYVAEAAANQCPLPFFAPGSGSANDIAQITYGVAAAFGLAAYRNTMA